MAAKEIPWADLPLVGLGGPNEGIGGDFGPLITCGVGHIVNNLFVVSFRVLR